MLQKGRSLHIGLNHVDTSAYPGFTIPELNACINDAVSMQLLAAKQGFITQALTDEQATASEVIRLISSFARELETGDFFLLSYSGHGGQVDDVNGDEEDAKDETWVLWDRMLIDDELFQLFSQFQAGVRILMLSDSCHSGTVARRIMYRDLFKTPGLAPKMRDMKMQPRFRGLDSDASYSIYSKNKKAYDTYQYLAGSKRDIDFAPSLILISGCQDHQLSADGDENGLFTEKLLKVWNDGAFQGDYRRFWNQIIAQMPPTQSPNFFTLGDVSAFSSEQLFLVNTQQFNPSIPQDPVMTVIGASTTRSRSSGAPDFQIDTQGAPYYIAEFATKLSLFDYQSHGAERTPQNFWGSWSESPVYEASNGFYPMPMSVWNALQSSDRIYFRVGTTTSLTGWDNYRVSTGDTATDGPSIELTD